MEQGRVHAQCTRNATGKSETVLQMWAGVCDVSLPLLTICTTCILCTLVRMLGCKNVVKTGLWSISSTCHFRTTYATHLHPPTGTYGPLSHFCCRSLARTSVLLSEVDSARARGARQPGLATGWIWCARWRLWTRPARARGQLRAGRCRMATGTISV